MITPAPPRADAHLPWDHPVADPVAEIRSAREQCGDTFEIVAGGTSYLFVFSPAGVRSFYELPESSASKGVADWQMLRRKVPDELFGERRTFPHELFGRDDTARYLDRLAWAIDIELDRLGGAGDVELFTFTRRLGHRMGLASWAGEEAAAPGERFERLMAALDVLDASDAFVRPQLMADVAAAGKVRERAALAEAEAVLIEAMAERQAAAGGAAPALVDRIVERWSDVADDGARWSGIARDIVLVHMGSMSNLFAALGWMLVDLVVRPDAVERLRSGDTAWTERCALESTRMAQRSIMMRAVLKPVEVDDGVARYLLAPGDILATLLPLTNLDSAPGLDRWDPDRWNRRRLHDDHGLAARELVTAFGHGAHTCPAQPFSLAAMVRAATAFFTRYDVSPRFTDPHPLVGQIGGVARSNDPCVVSYAARRPRTDRIVRSQPPVR